MKKKKQKWDLHKYLELESERDDKSESLVFGWESGWQKLRERGSGAPRKVRVFYERKDLQHTLFCRET